MHRQDPILTNNKLKGCYKTSKTNNTTRKLNIQNQQTYQTRKRKEKER